MQSIKVLSWWIQRSRHKDVVSVELVLTYSIPTSVEDPQDFFERAVYFKVRLMTPTARQPQLRDGGLID